MTIRELWDKISTFDLLELIPIFGVLAMAFITALVIMAVILGVISWWLHRRD